MLRNIYRQPKILQLAACTLLSFGHSIDLFSRPKATKSCSVIRALQKSTANHSATHIIHHLLPSLKRRRQQQQQQQQQTIPPDPCPLTTKSQASGCVAEDHRIFQPERLSPLLPSRWSSSPRYLPSQRGAYE